MNRKYTQEHIDFIATNIQGCPFKKLTDMFNKQFGMNLKASAIVSLSDRHGLHNFKKGSKSWNCVPIGSERVNGDGYIDIKVDDGKLQKNWKGKHILIWEADNGPVPPGHVVIFGDGNNRNFNPDNLILVSRKQLVRLNQMSLIQGDAELTKTGIAIADICNKIGERKRKGKQL